MFDKKNSCDTNEIIALVVKILAALVAVSAAVYAGIKIYEKIKFRRECMLCDCCCDEDFFDDEDICECECCCEETEKAEEAEEETEATAE